MPYFGPCALIGLLYTTLTMFAAQDIISQIGNVARVAVPMLLYFMIMFAASMAVSYALEVRYNFAVTQAFTAASNNFELAIAVAVGTFGIASQEALAATVGPLDPVGQGQVLAPTSCLGCPPVAVIQALYCSLNMRTCRMSRGTEMCQL